MKKNLLILFLFVQTALLAQGTYYNSISTASSTFITDLESRIRSPYTRKTYDEYKTTIIPNFESRDTTYSRKVITCIYSGLNYIYTPPFAWIGTSGVNADSGFSREHSWCQSWMPTVNASGFTNLPEYSDQHHLFPVNQNKANVVRNNHPLGNVVTLASSYLNAKFGTAANGKEIYEPRAEHKGDAARALLYMTVRYDGVGGYTWTFNNLNRVLVDSLSETTEDLNQLLQWHKQDPPSKWEVDRNTYIETIQGNRNPFVDHPEYVNYINFNNLTKLSPSYSAEPTNQPTGCSITSPTSSSITVSWTNAVAGSQSPSGYLIEIYNSNDYFIPIDGETYSDDINISDSKGLVNITNGATTTYTFSGLDCGTNYYVRMYAYNGDGTLRNYRIDGTVPLAIGSTTTSSPATEPTNYPAGFDTPTITSTSISIKWTDPTGAVLPTGYVLFANNSNIFTDPFDGVTYTDDSNLADGNAMVNVPYGTQQYTFSGLTPATSYSFKLFPYNGSGCQRNYKTTSFPGTLVLAYYTSSSGGGNTTPDVAVNEYFNGGTDVSEWVELLVLKDSLNMQGMKIRDYSGTGILQNVNTPLQFASVPEWESVRKGTFIVIFSPGTGAPFESTDFSTKKIILSSTNASYFIPGAVQFVIAGTADAVEVYNAGNTHIHALSHGSYPGYIATIPQPRANAKGSSSSGNVVRFINTSLVTNFSDTTKVEHSTIATIGLPNDATQTTFVNTVLPVELSDLSGRFRNGTVELIWKTATETNNYGFEIERKPLPNPPLQGEGIKGWGRIGFVEGAGNSNIPKSYSFIDAAAKGKNAYRLKQIDRDGGYEYSNVIEVNAGSTILTYELEQNFPNPFNPNTVISYQIPVTGIVTLTVYDVLGKEIETLINKEQDAGRYSIEFSVNSEKAEGIASGIYFYTLRSGSFSDTKKLILLK
jgi:endonuclease I